MDLREVDVRRVDAGPVVGRLPGPAGGGDRRVLLALEEPDPLAARADARDADGVVGVLVDDILARDEHGRRAVGSRTAVVEVQRMRHVGRAHRVLERALEPEVGVGVLRAVGVVLDRDHREVLTRRVVVPVQVGARHLRVHAGERRAGEPLPLRLAGDAEPVLGHVPAHVGHHLDTAREGDVRHPAFHRLDGLPDRVARRGAGVLDPRARDPVESEVFRRGRPGETELAAADAERADDRLVDVGLVDPVGDALDRAVERLAEQRPIAPVWHRAERRLPGADDVSVSHTTTHIGGRKIAFRCRFGPDAGTNPARRPLVAPTEAPRSRRQRGDRKYPNNY